MIAQSRKHKPTICLSCGEPIGPAGARIDLRISSGPGGVATTWRGKLCVACSLGAQAYPRPTLRRLLRTVRPDMARNPPGDVS